MDSDIELSVNVSFFPYRSLAGSLPRLRIRSYIEIVSDISTLSFFPSRLVKYRRCVRASREARKQRKRDGGSGEERGRWQTVAQEKGREREKKTGESQRNERRFALRRDRKRDSLGLVIYLKRSRAPCATTKGTEASAHHVPEKAKSEHEKESQWRRRRRQ